MASTFWIFLGVIVSVCIITGGVVRIIKAAKAPGGKFSQRFDDLEDEIHELEQDLADARKRIEVLEKIVTDQRYDLGREIDGLREAEL